VYLPFSVVACTYKKFCATASGGNDFIRISLTASTESSDQYHDGNGDNLTQQVKKKALTGNQYQSQYENMQAYKKSSM